MRLNIEKVHSKEQEVVAIKEQIAEMQKALSDSHLAIYDEKNYYMQLMREHNLLTNQEGNDKRKMNELSTLKEEISDAGSISQQENSARFVNYRDCRPSAKLKAAGKKSNDKNGVNGNPKPNQTQQNIMTNTLIKEKMNKDNSLSITAA